MLEAAIVTAKRHVADAEAAKADEAERGKAREALALLDDFSQRGKLLDKILDKFVRQYDELTRGAMAMEFHKDLPNDPPIVMFAKIVVKSGAIAGDREARFLQTQ